MKTRLFILVATLALGIHSAHAKAIQITRNYIEELSHQTSVSLLTGFLENYLRQFINGPGDYEGTLIETFEIERHGGGSTLVTRSSVDSFVHEWAHYFELIEAVPLNGRMTHSFNRVFSNSHAGRTLLTNPFYPYHCGHYRSECDEYIPGRERHKFVSMFGNTTWRLSLLSSNLGKLVEDFNGLLTHIEFYQRPIPPFCPVGPEPAHFAHTFHNVRWNNHVLVRPPSPQHYVLNVRYMGGSLWVR